LEENSLKNNKSKGIILFIVSLVAIILLIYLTQSADLGTKIIISGSSTGGNGSIEELIGLSNGTTDDGNGNTIYSYASESKISYIVISDDGIGYVLATDSTNTVSNITKSCDYYFNFVSEQELERLQNYIDNYNTYARIHNASADANNQWAIISQDSVHAGTSWWQTLLPYLSVIIVVAIGFILIKSILGANSKSFNFGKTKAQIAHNVKVKFSDVAGIDEEKEELQEIVEFLKNPQKFTELGAKIPKGILLVGLPGTGKTLLAKAIAGESNVPFFSISGSDFVEMFVGVGASRVRDLFDQAKKESPCIVFIDEIDAVGRQRGAGLGGGNDEREQTLNQLLVQMDGFEDNTGIIVIAATNRADVLDPALLRPGRFDRQIYINPPDVRGREMILKIHARNKPIDSSVDFKNLARLTSGFTGADIENLLNEAAILTAKENRKSITMTDITESINKVLMGPQKRSRIITDSDKRITACHESGHAVIGKVLEHCDVVQEVSIIPRGMAAGYTISRPDNDESHMSYNKLIASITQLLGGRAAEELLIKDISTGASNDIEKATKIARKMVTEWGMSLKLGPLNFASNSEVFLGRDYQTQVQYSEKTAAEIDAEVKKIVESCYEKAKEIIKSHVKEIDTMIDVLLEKETIYYNEVDLIMKGKSTKQVLHLMEKEETRNKAKIEIERAEADLEKTRKEQNIRIKTAEALKNGGVLSQEEIEKVKEDSAKVVAQAEEKVKILKDKNDEEKPEKVSRKNSQKSDTLKMPSKEELKKDVKEQTTSNNVEPSNKDENKK
jgi:cell division protease FtsH